MSAREDIEGYTLYDADISRCVLAPRNPSLSDAEQCAEANSAAVFHAMRGPDDEGMPCLEIAGILVFAYLDADREAVRVSVHLDTTDEQLVRADGTVPTVVEIGDATVFDNLTPPPAPAQPTGWKARFQRLTRRTPLGRADRGVAPLTQNTLLLDLGGVRMAPSVTHVSGTVAGGVEVRFTQDGIAVCRFRLTQTPTQWDTAAQKWRDLDRSRTSAPPGETSPRTPPNRSSTGSASWSRGASPESGTTPST
ncbi:hypothetical protein [Streptomyces sp. NPDC051001]|uniref:hypothetical protein n=1 Tax=Streptomyces sp. NPDC051001 TaxID=3155795 RepID=UPI0034175E15